MPRENCLTVWRPAPFLGAGLLALLTLSVLSGCRGAGDALPDGSAEELQMLGLPPGARIHRVTLGGRGSEEHAVPTRIEALPGDGVEFRTVDHRVHTLLFLSDSLTEEVRTYLESTGQTASPPLVSRGSRLILRLQNAPLGRYLFISEGHGGVARGIVEVGLPPGTDSTHTRNR